jgi:hypothetical protein
VRKTLAVLAAFSSISVLAACGGSHDNSAGVSKDPVSLIGEWHQTNAEETGVVMKASISPGSIQVNMDTRDQSGIYWLGTFDTDKGTVKGFTTVSKGDPDAMEKSLFGSQSKTKSFTYKDGEISYKLTILGTTTTVRLAKREYENPDDGTPMIDDWDYDGVKKSKKTTPPAKVPDTPKNATKTKK